MRGGGDCSHTRNSSGSGPEFLPVACCVRSVARPWPGEGGVETDGPVPRRWLLFGEQTSPVPEVEERCVALAPARAHCQHLVKCGAVPRVWVGSAWTSPVVGQTWRLAPLFPSRFLGSRVWDRTASTAGALPCMGATLARHRGPRAQRQHPSLPLRPPPCEHRAAAVPRGSCALGALRVVRDRTPCSGFYPGCRRVQLWGRPLWGVENWVREVPSPGAHHAARETGPLHSHTAQLDATSGHQEMREFRER